MAQDFKRFFWVSLYIYIFGGDGNRGCGEIDYFYNHSSILIVILSHVVERNKNYSQFLLSKREVNET